MTMLYGSKIEDVLQQLEKDIITPKFAGIKHTAVVALEILADEDKLKNIEAWELREICLEPLQLALESRARKLGHTALAGIQSMFKDERFRSSMETSDEDKWLPSQVLTVLAGAHSLAEDLQIEVMKLLLNMTVTASWCTSAKTIIKIAQTLLAIHTNKSSKEKARVSFLANLALFSLGDKPMDSDVESWLTQLFHSNHVYMGSYQNCIMVQGAVQAAFITMINKFVCALVEMEEAADDVGEDVLADFKANSRSVYRENLVTELALILTFLTDRLELVSSTSQGKQTLPLLLEGVNIILNKVPFSIKTNIGLQELLWKRLGPCLINLLSEPKGEKPVVQNPGKSELLKASAVASPNITQASAKIIFSIAGELASIVGSTQLLRPVLEALFQKILMFPLPQSKNDALRVFKELMSDPHKVVSIVGTTTAPAKDNGIDTNIALIKMLIESIHQNSHSTEPSIVYSSISCIDSLLESLDKIRQGEAIPDTLLKQQKGARGRLRRSMTSNPDDDGGSDVTCEQYDDSEDTSSAVEEIPEVTSELKCTEHPAVEPSSEKLSPKSPSRAQFEAEEQANARKFVAYLRHMMPVLRDAMSIREIDETLQDIAAQFCSSVLTSNAGTDPKGCSTLVVLNADGVYVSAIIAIKLNLKLIQSGYYQNRKLLPVTENDFTNEIFSSGLLLYLPPAWLREVYSQILTASLLDLDILTSSNRTSHLINMIQDLEGVGTTEERGRLISDFREELEVTDGDNANKMKKAEVGKIIAAAVLSNCWAEVLDILSVMLNEQVPVSGGGSMTRYSLSLLLAMDSAQEDVRKARSAICTSLNGLQRAAKLCCVLGLQQLCGSAFSQLARTSCVKEDFRAVAAAETKNQSKTSVLSSNKPKLVKLHAAHVLSMDVVMTTGLEMGSHSADCWRHVFRCCAHISELEHTYFSQGNNQSSLPKLTTGSIGQAKAAEADGNCDPDLYSSHVTAAIPVAPRINVPALIQQSGLESGWDNSLAAGGVLTFAQASKALCGLSQEVDSLFEGAADKLCLEALLQFLTELGESMLVQLHRLSAGGEKLSVGVNSRPPTNALHLFRLQQVLVRLVNGSRPLLHLLRVWIVVSPYLVQATSNPDHVISKMAVTSIHEFIVSLVSQREEKAHFHVNEFLCKTFEDMLCLELCDGDVQDQIVCCICELVEACSRHLQSGWRPLFGALRCVKIEYTTSESVNEARQRHVAAVMDVFDIYLGMDNITVFSNAMVDCVLCLLKYVNGPATYDGDSSDDRSESGSEEEYGSAEGELENLCVPALKYLTRVCQILAFMWKMPACPVFKGAHRIQADSASRLVDPDIPSIDFKLFMEEFQLDKATVSEAEENQLVKEQIDSDVITETKETLSEDVIQSTEVEAKSQNETQERSLSEGEDADADRPLESSQVDNLSLIQTSTEKECSVESDSLKPVITRPNQLSVLDVPNQNSKANSPNEECDQASTQLSCFGSLEEMDNKSGVLHVWFLLLDGLVSSVNRCPKAGQAHALNTLIDLLRAASKVPGPEFSLHCVNHLLLPMLQSWLRRGARCYGYWNTAIVSFKQCCGQVADLTVEFLKTFSGEKLVEQSLQLMLKQTFDVFKECVAQPVENISRLGCSCIRHIILSAGHHMSEPLWQISSVALRQALGVTTYNLQLLMALFQPNSDNFYGDIGQVKVATRKDCTVVDCLRLRQMAKQVFLLDSQISTMPNVQYDTDQDKSFVFLLYPPNHKDSLNPDHISTRVPFRHVVIGLLSNQLLLQTVGSILLERSAGTEGQGPQGLPGQLSYMSTRNVHQILSGLQDVYKVARDFDARPGLKFLLQKVACLDVAANLYRQAASAILFHAHALIEICAHLEDVSITATKAAITPSSETPETPGVLPSLSDLHHAASTSLARPCTDGKLFLQMLQIMFEELCQSYTDVLQDAGKGSILDKMSEKPIFFLTAKHDNISQIAAQAQVAALQEIKSSERQSSHKSRSLDREPISETEGLSSVAVTSQQSQSESEAGTDSDGEEGTKQSSATSVTSKEEEEYGGRQKSKRELREELQSKVYTVATDQVIENLMSQYKRHKHQRAMPNYVRLPKFQKPKVKVQRKEPVDDVIDKQQKSSIMKDSEAHVQAWSDTLTAILQMTLSLPDQGFSSLLPLIFTFVSNLILHAPDPALRDQLSQCFIRLGRMFDFAPQPAVLSATK
ncbi:brefeldin A-inhibited guanine nucleotide-exchange protein 3-like isoform X1 [Biomphalaria glabrata]|nr:brefeldin A-inhibited guanine nucleotide-exchange protein 3-like isoform X1 [Biomphalaria glabrata]